MRSKSSGGYLLCASKYLLLVSTMGCASGPSDQAVSQDWGAYVQKVECKKLILKEFKIVGKKIVGDEAVVLLHTYGEWIGEDNPASSGDLCVGYAKVIGPGKTYSGTALFIYRMVDRKWSLAEAH